MTTAIKNLEAPSAMPSKCQRSGTIEALPNKAEKEERVLKVQATAASREDLAIEK